MTQLRKILSHCLGLLFCGLSGNLPCETERKFKGRPHANRGKSLQKGGRRDKRDGDKTGPGLLPCGRARKFKTEKGRRRRMAGGKTKVREGEHSKKDIRGSFYCEGRELDMGPNHVFSNSIESSFWSQTLSQTELKETEK